MIKVGFDDAKVATQARVEGDVASSEVGHPENAPPAPGDVIVASKEGAPVVVPKATEPPTIAELAAARRGQALPVKQAQPIAVAAPPTPPNLDANVRAFFAAYGSRNPAAMQELLAAKTVYEDPVFPHLEDDAVRTMWKVVAGGDTGVKPQIDSVKVGDHSVEVDWVAKYNFLGAPIANHIHSSFTFDDEGKITRQKDTFDWRAWGNQTPAPAKYLLRTWLGQKLVQFALGRKVAGAS